MFAAAGIDEPDGSWTWDDFADLAAELTSALEGTDYRAKGAYMHNWQSTLTVKLVGVSRLVWSGCFD